MAVILVTNSILETRMKNCRHSYTALLTETSKDLYVNTEMNISGLYSVGSAYMDFFTLVPITC